MSEAQSGVNKKKKLGNFLGQVAKSLGKQIISSASYFFFFFVKNNSSVQVTLFLLSPPSNCGHDSEQEDSLPVNESAQLFFFF